MRPSHYGPFPYIPITRRPPLRWPNGKTLALWVIPNIEFFALDDSMPSPPGVPVSKIPDVYSWSIRDYGNRVGVFRLMGLLKKHGIRATVALNSNLCEVHPEIIRDAMSLDWELMGHNQTNTRRLNTLPPDEEQGVIRATLDTIEKACGKRPKGWLGSGLQETWNTLGYLAQEGVRYVGDWVNDDQPYRMDADGKTMVALPYSCEINDKPAYETFGRTSDEFAGMIRRQFDLLYEESQTSARVMAIALHPYLSGQPHRISALDAALTHICGHTGVWCATGTEITDSFLKATAA
jgi:allantoinase